jgi:hypothetical protein
MSRVICVTGTFPVYDRHNRPTGEKVFAVSHGIDEATGRNVILPSEHPARLGARLDPQLNEWVLDDATP